MATIAEVVKSVLPAAPAKPSPQVTDRLTRGRARMRDDSPRRNECLKFWRGDQYIYRSQDGMLVNQNTITLPNGSGKPRHRVRTTRNLIKDIVAHEVAAGTSRMPGYDVTPSTSEPEDIDAARIANKVAFYGYDKWKIRGVTRSVITYAVVADEGFAWPYWDSSVGPYIQSEEGVVGQGEVRVRIFGPNEVYWEPGLKFNDSRWHAVEQARPIEDVMEMEGYLGGKLEPDANASDDDGIEREKLKQQARLVLVTEYLERPCKKYPEGRWLTIANGKVIAPERGYPCRDHENKVVDEPVLHMLSYFDDPDNDRDMGLVRDLIDAQRTVNDATNKRLEWKNLALNPQVIIQNGEFKQRLTDEPGAVYHAVGSGQITWREVPPIPKDLQDIKDDAVADMARMSAQNDIPTQVESGKAIQVLVEKDASRRADFLGNLAEWHGRLMRHCLYLVQRHYTEERTLTIQGRRGTPARYHNFKGAQLRGQADITVLPGSITPRTREAITAQVMAFADRGWISPHAAMTAINGGTAENLIEAYEADVGRANQIIQKIQDETAHLTPPRPPFGDEDPGWEVPPEVELDETGQPVLDEMGEPIVVVPGIPATTIPGWMPRPFDNELVHLDVFSAWMKSPDFDSLKEPQMMQANAYYSSLLEIQARNAERARQLQMEEAESLGMQNAAKPQDKGRPDQSNGTGEGADAQIFGERYKAGSTQPF